MTMLWNNFETSRISIKRKNSEGLQADKIKLSMVEIEKIVKELNSLEEVLRGLYKIALKDVAAI